MDRKEMDELIARHLAAENVGDAAGCVAMYTDDVEHDVVGAPHGPLHGPQAAQGFYDYLTANVRAEEMVPTRAYYGDDFCVTEHSWTGTVPGQFFGVAGHGRRITFRMLHVWEFRDGLISRENVWLDGAGINAQLVGGGQPATAPA
ncbi:MAG: nuclear transport factor 2 family protein [Candidatus Dormibacteraeota bacterium]|nr:nuclear transport factor 2 family protein [Candidatus Dormibacteraeota bacterium]